MTKDQAVALYESCFWNAMTARDIAMFQLFEDRLCMPIEIFHAAIEEALGRPVYTHEFGLNRDGLKGELVGARQAPTIEEIMGLIPADKLLIVGITA